MIFLFNMVIFKFHVDLPGCCWAVLRLSGLVMMFLFAAVWISIFPILNDEPRGRNDWWGS